MDERRNEVRDTPGSPDVDRLAEVFKVLADPMRLRLLGLLAERPHTGKALADRLRLTAPTISHHVTRLAAVDLIRVAADAQRRIYSLNEPTWRGLGRASNRHDEVVDTSASGPSHPDPVQARVLKNFFVGERLKQIPAKRKQRVIVLQYLLGWFAPDREYAESEVNEVLRRAHDDVATLRRELVDYGYLLRDNGIYRVAGADELPQRSVQVSQEISNDERSWLLELVISANRSPR